MIWAGLSFLALFVFSVIFVALCGTRWERLGIGVVFIGSLATLAVAVIEAQDWTATVYSVLFVDLTGLLAFGYIALRSDRFWPLWVTGMQLAQLTTHMAKMASPSIVPKAYENGLAVWSWLQILVIVLATWHLRQKVQRAKAAKPKS